MSEIRANDANETKLPEVENYKNIQPENGMTVSEAKSFWDEQFKADTTETAQPEFGGKYNSEEKRLGCVPLDGETGSFDGERGNSKFVPLGETERGQACRDKLSEYGKDGIEYKNLEPDFSEVSEGTVKIDDMTEEFRNGMMNRIQQGICSDESSILFSEMLTDFERIGDHALNIAKEMTQISFLEE